MDITNLSIASLTALYNTVAEKPIGKFKDRTTGIGRVQAILDEKNMVVIEKDGELLFMRREAMSSDADESPKPRGRTSPLLGRRLKVVSETNPKRPSTRTYARFELYKGVETTTGYMNACLEQNLGTRREILSDLAWDSEQGFIKIYAN